MTKKRGRVVGLDVHPDSFAGAVVEGTDPAQRAGVEHFNPGAIGAIGAVGVASHAAQKTGWCWKPAATLLR